MNSKMNKTILVDNNRYVECECDHEHAKPVDDFGDYVCSGARFNVCEIVKCYETQIQESNQSIKRPSKIQGLEEDRTSDVGGTDKISMKSDSKQGSESSNCEFVICSNRISTDAVISPSSTTVKNSANAGEQSTSISDNRNSTIIKVVDDATTEIVSGEQVYKSHTVIESIPNGIRIITDLLCNENEKPLQLKHNKVIKTEIPSPSALLKKFNDHLGESSH